MAELIITPAQFAQELKDKLPIEDIVREYVPSLAQRGRSWKGLCPFHKEKTPSFHVQPELGFYHCFGCGAHGDVIKFVQELEKIDFMLALEQLARRAGIDLPQFRAGVGAGPGRDEGHLRELRTACEWAGDFFIEQMRVHPRGQSARDYLHGRGLNDEEIKQYGLGYAPQGYEVLLHAGEKRGYSGDLLAEAGLVSRREQGGFVDRFRDRVMFPIADAHGQLVAFAGRLIDDIPDAAKYINSAETPLFKKSQLLFGLAAARETIRETNSVILLEGYMDWLAMHRAGIRNVLAGMGTALTPEQARLIKRMAKKVYLLYDGDAAGQKALLRGAEMLLQQQLEVHAAVLPAEHDPDSFLSAHGTQQMRDLLETAPMATDYFIDAFALQSNLARPEGKAEAAGKLAPLLLAIEDPVLREGYLGRAAARFGLQSHTLEALLKRRRPAADRHPRAETQERHPDGLRGAAEEGDAPPAAPSRTEQYLLYILMQTPNPWDLLPRINPLWIGDEVLRTLFEQFYDLQRDIREGADPPSDPFAICVGPSQREWLSRILLLPEWHFGGEVRDFHLSAFSDFELQLLKMNRSWIERRRRELEADLQIIAPQAPSGRGELAQIERLARDAMDQTTSFFGAQSKGNPRRTD